MISQITRDEALNLLKTYNKEPFHILHGLTVEGVMRWYARELGYGDEEDFWGICGLLHDIDFELYPEQHCTKAPELLKAGGVGDGMIHAICSHGYGICCDVEPVHEMEKVLYAVDELTGLIGAVALMRPSKSTLDLELKSVKKKYRRSTLPRAVPVRSFSAVQICWAGRSTTSFPTRSLRCARWKSRRRSERH